MENHLNVESNQGKVIQVGHVHGDLNVISDSVSSDRSVRNDYPRQVARIAPPELIGREAELAELASFCKDPATAGRYLWLRAGPWAGKTALMSWFALHPPEDVRVVSFFVTARLSRQNDSAAFVANLIPQLLALSGATGYPPMSTSTQESLLLGLLADAAETCANGGTPLVLLVDGLDEDHGVTTDPDAHSIAALLPLEPPHGMRVIVSGRETPAIPRDVPDHHPLRRPDGVYGLAPSPAAHRARARMEDELVRLVDGSPLEQEIIGLLAACAGGLTTADLAYLTRSPGWRIDRLLGSVAGRTFTTRPSGFRPGVDQEIHLLGHAELGSTAVDMLGDAVDGYRDRLRAWADLYQRLGWPDDTPEYLLSDYVTLLWEERDSSRLAALVGDVARTELLAARSGGDLVALVELRNAAVLQRARPVPDFPALARIAVTRGHLFARNRPGGTELAGAYAKLGRFDDAENAARAITTPHSRARALVAVTIELAAAHRFEHAVRIVEDLQRSTPASARTLLIDLIPALVDAGAPESAEAIVTHVFLDEWPELGLGELMRAEFRNGHHDRAAAFARGCPPYGMACALGELVLETAKRGSVPEELGTEVGSLAESLPPEERVVVLARLAEAHWRVGDEASAARLAATVASLVDQVGNDVAVTRVALASGWPEPAAVVAGHILRLDTPWALVTDTPDQVGRLEDAARRRLIHGVDFLMHHLIRRWIAVDALYEAERCADTLGTPDIRASALVDVARALIRNHQAHDAWRIIDLLRAPEHRARLYAVLAEEQVDDGTGRDYLHLAEELDRTTAAHHETSTRGILAYALHLAGERDRARRRCEQWKQLATAHLTGEEQRLVLDDARVLSKMIDSGDEIVVCGEPFFEECGLQTSVSPWNHPQSVPRLNPGLSTDPAVDNGLLTGFLAEEPWTSTFRTLAEVSPQAIVAIDEQMTAWEKSRPRHVTARSG